MTTNWTKLSLAFPFGCKIYLMAIKIPTSSITRTSKIYPKWDFWFEIMPSGNPASYRRCPQPELPFRAQTLCMYLSESWDWLFGFYFLRNKETEEGPHTSYLGPGWPGTDVMIFKNVFAEKFKHSKTNVMIRILHNLTLFGVKSANFFRQKLSKIEENCDYNIDPRLAKLSPGRRFFTKAIFWNLNEY
jgi:hypothetical protein